jgi:hypothetical protein
MFGINLTTMQKVEVALILIILGCAGFFVFRNFQPTFDHTVKTYPLATRQHPVNDNPGHTARVGTTNPRDPKKDESVIEFACADGRLDISTFPNDPMRHMTFTWFPEKRQPGLVYQYYQDPMAPVDGIKDPFRQALARATYSKVHLGRTLGLLGSAAMSEAQLPQEAAARKQMDSEISVINADCDSGTFHPELMDQIVKALAAYDAKPGDPEKDTVKAVLAHKVLRAVADYRNRELSEKDQAIDAYMAAIDKLLTADQKQKVIDASKASTRPAVRGAPASRRGGTAATAARGGAVTRGGAVMRNGAAPAAGSVGPETGSARGAGAPAGG